MAEPSSVFFPFTNTVGKLEARSPFGIIGGSPCPLTHSFSVYLTPLALSFFRAVSQCGHPFIEYTEILPQPTLPPTVRPPLNTPSPCRREASPARTRPAPTSRCRSRGARGLSPSAAQMETLPVPTAIPAAIPPSPQRISAPAKSRCVCMFSLATRFFSLIKNKRLGLLVEGP